MQEYEDFKIKSLVLGWIRGGAPSRRFSCIEDFGLPCIWMDYIFSWPNKLLHNKFNDTSIHTTHNYSINYKLEKPRHRFISLIPFQISIGILRHRRTFICILFHRYIGQSTAPTHVLRYCFNSLAIRNESRIPIRDFSVRWSKRGIQYTISILTIEKEQLHANKIAYYKGPKLWTIYDGAL